MYEDASLALGCHNQHHRKKVRGETRPGGIGQSHYGAVQEGVNLIAVLGGDVNVISALLQLDSKAAERVRNYPQVIPGDVLDGDFTLADGGHADKGAHLNHIRQDLVLRAAEFLYAVDTEEVGAHAVNESAHTVEHLAKLLDIGLTGGVVDGCGALCKHCGHHNVGCTGNRGFFQEHVSACKTALRGKVESPALRVILHPGAKVTHAVKVGVHPAAADFITARLREPRMAEPAQERAHHHHASAKLGAFFHKLLSLNVGCVHFIGLEGITALGMALHLHTHAPQELYEVFDIKDFGDIAYFDGFC